MSKGEALEVIENLKKISLETSDSDISKKKVTTDHDHVSSSSSSSYKNQGKAVMVEEEEEEEEDPPFVTENVKITGKKLTLKTGDGKVFEVEEAAMLQSETIKNMIEDGCADGVIPIPNLTGEIFAKIVEYCNKHVGEKKLKKKEKEELEEWDDEFVDLDRDDLCNLLSAAMYLNIESLVDLAAQEFADMIKNLPIEKVREILGIENDFTPEEEAEIRQKNIWAIENFC